MKAFEKIKHFNVLELKQDMTKEEIQDFIEKNLPKGFNLFPDNYPPKYRDIVHCPVKTFMRRYTITFIESIGLVLIEADSPYMETPPTLTPLYSDHFLIAKYMNGEGSSGIGFEVMTKERFHLKYNIA